VGHAGALNDRRTLEPNRRRLQIGDVWQAAAKQHRNEVHIDLVEQPRVQQLPG
jgi:hypothetical protein